MAARGASVRGAGGGAARRVRWRGPLITPNGEMHRDRVEASAAPADAAHPRADLRLGYIADRTEAWRLIQASPMRPTVTRGW